MIYLDHASTTPLRPEAREAMAPWMERAADPARVHSAGLEARVAVEAARDQVAASMGWDRPRDVVFCSSGTEALNWVVYAACGLLAASAGPWGRRIVVSAVEHSAVLDAARSATTAAGLDLIVVPVDSEGRVEAFEVAADTALAAVQHVSHETGVVQALDGLAARCTAAGARLLVDDCQGMWLAPPPGDFVVRSSHKLGGPAGIAALAIGPRIRLPALFVGGEQELLRRAGGENVAGAVGFGAAAAAAPPPDLATLQERLEAGLAAVGGVAVLGAQSPRSPHITTVVVPGLSGEAMLLALDRDGIAVNSGSSCSSERLEPSHVILAMGADGDATLRFSTGWPSTSVEIDAAVDAFGARVGELRSIASGR